MRSANIPKTHPKEYVLKRIDYKNKVDAKLQAAELHDEFARIHPKLVDHVSEDSTKQQLIRLYKIYRPDDRSIHYAQKIDMRNEIKSILQKESTSQEVVDYCIEFLNTHNAW